MCCVACLAHRQCACVCLAVRNDEIDASQYVILVLGLFHFSPFWPLLVYYLLHVFLRMVWFEAKIASLPLYVLRPVLSGHITLKLCLHSAKKVPKKVHTLKMPKSRTFSIFNMNMAFGIESTKLTA